MKTFAIVAVLCALSVSSAAPLDFLGGLLKTKTATNSQASGSAAGNVVTGSSGGPLQNSEIVQVSAQAGGSASGNAVSTNSASASNTRVSGIFGTQQQSNTNAVSNQQTFDQLGGLLQQPYQNNFQPNFQNNFQPNFQPQFRPQQLGNQQFGNQQFQNQQFQGQRYF